MIKSYTHFIYHTPDKEVTAEVVFGKCKELGTKLLDAFIKYPKDKQAVNITTLYKTKQEAYEQKVKYDDVWKEKSRLNRLEHYYNTQYISGLWAIYKTMSEISKVVKNVRPETSSAPNF